MEQVVRGGVRTVGASDGHTVKVSVRGLSSDRWYFRSIDTFDAEATAVTFARFRVVANRPGIETLPL